MVQKTFFSVGVSLWKGLMNIWTFKEVLLPGQPSSAFSLVGFFLNTHIITYIFQLDDRTFIPLSTFGFIKDGTLEVYVSNFTIKDTADNVDSLVSKCAV